MITAKSQPFTPAYQWGTRTGTAAKATRQEDDYLIPNLALPDTSNYQIGKYGHIRRTYLKEHRKVLYANLVVEGKMEIIVSAMAKQENVTEALKAADQMEWVHRMNSIRSRAEEIILTELVYA